MPSTPAVRLLRAGLHGAFYVLLVIALAPAPGRLLLPAILLGVVYALGVLDEHRRAPRARVLVWLGAVSLLWLALLALDHNFSYLAFPLFFLFLHMLRPRWALPAVALATTAVIAAQATGAGGLTMAKVIGPTAGAAVAVLTAYGYAALYRESRERQRLIDDLMRTRDQLAASQREAGKLAERQRLAREIHDTLAQGLSSIVLLSRAAESALPDRADTATARIRIRETGRTAADNLAEARRFVQALTPPALADAPLPEALRRLTQRHGTDTGGGTEISFQLDGEPCPLPVEAEVALLRLTQEALANVARHAQARHAAVTLSFLDREVALDIYDDGIGFTPGESPQGGRPTFGLHGMRERIAELGGTLTVESAPGEGTAVAAALPVTAPLAVAS
ncbi:sensor histidine kinase [Streptomyces gobiensis]|uniref:sensor histidine kinase n=1 Tax=Streptomyces gobiensis TaxID=2875706 RepID=UPI001E398CB2|nr:sensor histidine kinase [Streptomyces gobiensis]UGY94182.1 sensor histidine kinase [Streptomyces gobiensis]